MEREVGAVPVRMLSRTQPVRGSDALAPGRKAAPACGWDNGRRGGRLVTRPSEDRVGHASPYH